MTTLRVALDAAQMLAISKQVAAALDEMGRKAKQAGSEFDNTERRTQATARSLDVTRESLKATAGAIQSAGNLRNLVDSLKQVDGGFASIANVAANAAQTVLSFARAFDDFKDVGRLSEVVVDLPGTLDDAAEAAKGVGSAAQTAATALGAQAAATTTATGATSLFTRATLALRAAWAAHPVLLIGTVLAAAATAMAAFAGNTKKATEETDALAEQQRALEQALKNVQKIRAEAVVGQRFGIAGAADIARQREREAVFQQAVTVEQARLQGGGRIPVSALGAAGTPEDIISSRAQLSLRFQRQVEQEVSRLKGIELAGSMSGLGRTDRVFSKEELQKFEADATKTVRDSFVVGYEEAIQILQGRFDDLGTALQRSMVSGPEIERIRQSLVGAQATPLLSQEEINLRAAEDVDAYFRKVELLNQINAGLADEARLATLTTDQREREAAILAIKQQAAQAGVELSQQELANIEATLAARQRQAQIDRQAQFNREVLQPSQQDLFLAGFDQDQRQIEAAVLAARAQAEASRTQFGVAQEEQIRANMAAMQQMENLRAVGQEVGSALGGAFVNAATGVATLRQALAALLQDLLRIAAQRAIIAPLANALGGAFSGLGSTPSQQQSNIEARNMTYEPA